MLRLREIFDFCIDFDLYPQFMNKRDIEQCYQAVHHKHKLDEMNDIGLNCFQFSKFIVL